MQPGTVAGLGSASAGTSCSAGASTSTKLQTSAREARHRVPLLAREHVFGKKWIILEKKLFAEGARPDEPGLRPDRPGYYLAILWLRPK